MSVRKIKRGQGGAERGGMPSQRGRMAPQQARPTRQIMSQKKHMENDALIIGFIFEP